MARKASRREFLKAGLGVLGVAVLAACTPKATPTTPPKVEPTKEATPKPTAGPAATENVSNRNLQQIARLADNKVTLTAWCTPVSTQTEVKGFNDQFFDKKMEELTNIHIEWKHSAAAGDQAAVTAAVDLLMASGELPDLVVGNFLADPIFTRYGMKGAFEPLDDYIGPNLGAFFKAHPLERVGDTAADGHLYMFPNWAATIPWAGPYVRQDWLDEVGMSVPETMEQYYEVLKAWKEKDPNRIPLTRDPLWIIWQWGVGAPAFYFDGLYHDGNEVKYGPMEPGYAEGLVYIQKLLKEGLLDPEYAQLTEDTLVQRMATVSGSAFVWNAHFTGACKLLNKAVTDCPLRLIPAPKGPYGHSEAFWGDMGGLGMANGAAISAKSKNKELAARYFDLYYSDSGATLFAWGVYGDTYTETDGKRAYTDKVMKHSTLTSVQYLWNYVSPLTIGPGVRPAEAVVAMRGGVAELGLKFWGQMGYDLLLPVLSLSDEEQAAVQESMPDIKTLTAEVTTGIITGQKSFDDLKNAVETFKSRGVDKALKAYQTSFDRWLAMKAKLGL